MKCPCKGCDRRTLTCHGLCADYQKWKTWKEEGNKVRAAERESDQLSRDHEMKYRRSLKGGWK